MALLIPCQPIQVLPGLAKAVGLNEAIFLQQLHYWLERSAHEHDGRVWVYNTFEEWQSQFPFWSLRTMHRIAASLVKRKLLLVHKFNSQNWDQKNWYSIDYEALSLLNTDHAKLAGSSMSEWRDLDHAKLAGSYKGSETTTETTNTPPISPTSKLLPEPESAEPPFAGKEFLSALAAYDRTAKKRKVKESPDQRYLLFKKLARWGEERATQALEDAVTNSWQGVFEPKPPNGNGHSNGNGSAGTYGKCDPDRPLFMAGQKR